MCSTRTFFAARLPAVDHHRQGIAGLVPHRVHAALRLYLATRPRAPFERPGIALEEMLPYATQCDTCSIVEYRF